MINGSFVNFKKQFGLADLMMLGGLFAIAVYVYAVTEDAAAAGELLFMPILALVGILCWGFIKTLNWNAFLIMEGEHIVGKYNWFGKIDCSVSEIAFAMARENTLTILQKDGRQHSIVGISNPTDFSTAINRHISVAPVDPNEAAVALQSLRSTYKKYLWLIVCCSALMFGVIFAAAALTGWREMAQFSQTDKIVMAVAAVTELAVIAALFWMAVKGGACLLPISRQQYILRRSMVETTPLPPCLVFGVYTDDDYALRVLLAGYPNDDGAYYLVQAFVQETVLETVHKSEVYDTIDALMTACAAELSEMRDISHILHTNR